MAWYSTMWRMILIGAIAFLAAAMPACAQTPQRVVVVPAGVDVVIAARGQRQPRSALGRAPSQTALERSRAARPASGGGSDEILGAAAPAILPLIAAGVVAATLASGRGGQGGGTSAPAQTR